MTSYWSLVVDHTVTNDFQYPSHMVYCNRVSNNEPHFGIHSARDRARYQSGIATSNIEYSTHFAKVQLAVVGGQPMFAPIQPLFVCPWPLPVTRSGPKYQHNFSSPKYYWKVSIEIYEKNHTGLTCERRLLGRYLYEMGNVFEFGLSFERS